MRSGSGSHAAPGAASTSRRSARPSRRAARPSTGSQADGPTALRFCKLRAASFVNYGVFNRVFDSQVLTDFAFVEHSLGLSAAGCDA